MRCFILLIMVLATQGCSSGGGNGDGGLPDGNDADGGDGYVVELANLARVHFKPGETLLPEDLTDMQADLNADPVEMLYLGSDLTEIRRSPLVSYSEEK